MTPHSTVVLSTTLNTVSTLFTVFGARSVSAAFNRCTSSVLISSRRLSPNAFARCTRSTVSFEAMPLGLSRFAFAYPSRNRKANSFNVGIF
jgi:hypothetical protein